MSDNGTPTITSFNDDGFTINPGSNREIGYMSWEKKVADLNEFLAINVMGWEISTGPTAGIIDKNFTPCYYSTKHEWWIPVKDWNPSENIGQAMMCLGTIGNSLIESWSSGTDGKRYHRVIAGDDYGEDSESFESHTQESLPYAISLACARARGYQEYRTRAIQASNDESDP